jgi:hypothetical protein
MGKLCWKIENLLEDILIIFSTSKCFRLQSGNPFMGDSLLGSTVFLLYGAKVEDRTKNM